MKKGFTLIELLVVIAIIAVLTNIVLANLNDSKKKSRDTKRISDIAQIQLALELYYDKCRSYPSTLSPLANNGPCPTGINLGTFMSKIPVPPINSEESAYKYAGLGSLVCVSYHLGATLEVNNQNGVLRDDVDASAGSRCSGSGPDFSSTASDAIYDVKP